jgi:hypothetical protein
MLMSNFLIYPSFYPHHRVISLPPLTTMLFETQSPSLLVDVVCLLVLINEQCCVQKTPGHSARVPHVTNTIRSSCCNCSIQATMWPAGMISYTQTLRTSVDFRVHRPFELWKRWLESLLVNGSLPVIIKTLCDCLTLHPNKCTEGSWL